MKAQTQKKRRDTRKARRKTNRPTSRARVAQPIAWALLALIPAQSYASECEQNSDCGAGWRCEVVEQGISTCNMSEEGEEICEELTESYGFCVELPIDCETDSDCPSHLRCGQPDRPSMPIEVEPIEPADSGMSSGSSGGEAGEEEEPIEEPVESPDMPPVMEGEPEEGPTMCIFVPEACESDADCAESFHCETVTYATPCARPEPAPCPEGEECDFEEEPGDDCRDAEVTESFCAPDEIECDSDDMCPADWSCRQFTEFECGDVSIGDATDGASDGAMGSGGLPGAEGGAPDADDEPGEESSEEPGEEPVEWLEPMEDCEELTRSLCVPAGLYGFGATSSSDLATSSPGSDPGSASGSSEPAPTAEPGDGEGSGGEGNEEREEGQESQESQESGESPSASDSDDEGGCDARRSPRTPWLLMGLFALIGATRRRLIA